MLATDGRVGPAFDSVVRSNMDFRTIDETSEAWLQALERVSDDIRFFQQRTGQTLRVASGLLDPPHAGRVYDMALGPRAKARDCASPIPVVHESSNRRSHLSGLADGTPSHKRAHVESTPQMLAGGPNATG
jgi:hypothetical protein